MTIRSARLAAVLIVVASIAQASCGDMTSCPFCPATYLSIGLVVRGSGSADVPNGASVAIAGPQVGTMSCEPNQGAMLCSWPAPVPVTPGTYSLEVTAPGFASMTISATIAIDPDPDCGCTLATLTPSDVTLEPM